jgi:hypothetical protein
MAVALRIRVASGERVLLVRSIEQDPILPENVLIKGAAGVREDAFPNLVVAAWSIPKRMVVSYTAGELEPEAPRVTAETWTPGE